MKDVMCTDTNYTLFPDGFDGFRIVESALLHKVKDEYAMICLYPIPEKGRKSKKIKVAFENERDFWAVYNHKKKQDKPWQHIFVVCGEWKKVVGKDYYSECVIRKKTQHVYIS